MKSINIAIYCVSLFVISFVGHQAITNKTENVMQEVEQTQNSRTQQLCQLDKSFCK